MYLFKLKNIKCISKTKRERPTNNCLSKLLSLSLSLDNLYYGVENFESTYSIRSASENTGWP